MAQHDYNLSNNTGALYRADNNAALQAIVTQNSGTTAPAVTFPGMLWLDLSGGGDGVMRRRNQANTAWLTDIGQDQVARDAAAAAQATANAAMPKTGGTFTGAINLPATVPTNNNAVSRAQADVLYQVKLPATQAGALLYGSASGWTGVLPPAANDTVMVLSGGLPTWATGAVTAVPNAYVRTRPDGTLDPSLIPGVASGLKFRGTFKPAVNAEYPTTGGTGAAGAPAVGDFWVIDGLTTGGYTYLTGTLAGVTVYNGDSIAYNGTGNWYRMGSSVQLEGYLKIDGSIAMTGDLNMGTHYLREVGGIAARAGTPVPLSNFSIDASNVVISPQRGTTGADLAAMAAGRLATDIGRMQLFVGAGASNTGLLAVRWFSATTDYVTGDYVNYQGQLYRAKQAISAGAFTASQWDALFPSSFNDGRFVFKTGDTMTGNLTVANSQAATTAVGVSNYDAAGQCAFRLNAAGGAPWAEISVNSAGWPVLPDAFVIGTKIARKIVITVNNEPRIAMDPGTGSNVFTSGSAYHFFDSLTPGSTGCVLVVRDPRSVNANNGGTIDFRARNNNDQSVSMGYIKGMMRSGVVGAESGDLGFYTVAGAVARLCVRMENTALKGQGDISAVGNLSAANFPSSDAALKENIRDLAPRDFASMPFHEFNFIGNPRKYRGPLAQDVEAIAPDHVFGEEGSKTLNYGSLAIEMALNALHRITILEEQVNATE